MQGVNHHSPEVAEFLQEFAFLPYASLDDLMVNFSLDQGGVGPHFDSYDVFLLKGEGERLWRISEQEDLSLVEGAPLPILQNFNAEQEWLLGPGDMLYLPLCRALGDCSGQRDDVFHRLPGAFGGGARQ